MLSEIFDIDSSPIANKIKGEISVDVVKSIEMVNSEGNCDHFIESARERIERLSENPNIRMKELFEDFPPCKFKLMKVNILGEYLSEDRRIIYYRQAPELFPITQIHERFHAIHHLTSDARNKVWVNFAKTDPFYKELLAQLFTYIYIRDFQPRLENTFLQLNERQPFIYKTFRIFQHYDQAQAEELYWIIRNRNKSNPIYKGLTTLAGKVQVKPIKATKKKSSSKPIQIVPSSELRYFYASFTKLNFSTKTQTFIAEDLLRKNNPEKLVELYKRSFEHISRVYNNPSEEMTGKSKRKPLPVSSGPIKKTTDVVSWLAKGTPITVTSSPGYSFEYVNREVSPLRTTHAEYDTQIPASRSGTGGLDFIGWNLQSNLPVLGEIKVEGDQNPFYALIQLLTYLSEMSTPNQINRINLNPLFGFGRNLPEDVKFHLVILSCRKDTTRGKYSMILPATKLLAKKITGRIDQIKDIVFLYMDPKTNSISVE